MKKTYRFYWLVLSALLLAHGCNKKLDINPTTSVDASAGVKDLSAVLEGAYALLGSGFNPNSNNDDLYGGNLIMVPDLLVADGYLIWTGTYNQYRDIVNHRMVNTSSVAANIWARAYECIESANLVLANLDKAPAAQKEQFEAEARFIRGIIYFELIRLYGQQWVPGQANNQPGVPLVLQPTLSVADVENSQVARATVAQVYEQVLGDLNFAKAKLTEDNAYHANTYTASGFLSRVYLQQSRYAEALAEVNRVITEGPYALVSSVDKIYNTNASSESMFEIQQTDQNNAGINNNGLYAFYGCGGSPAGNGRGDINPDSTFYNLYTDSDARKADLFYVGSCTKSGNLTSGKWKDPYSNYVVMRLAEMYLTRAECNYRLGSAVGDTPLNDVNAIKARAQAPTLNAITSLEDILFERRLELAYEGFGIHDVRRMQGSVGELAWNDPSLLFPIPLREINANKSLVQNPGY